MLSTLLQEDPNKKVETLNDGLNWLDRYMAQPAKVIKITSITNLASHPQGVISLTLGSIPTGVTNEPLLVDVLVAYPPGVGLSHTPVADFGVIFNDPTKEPADLATLVNRLDYSHREAHLQYITEQLTIQVAANGITSTTLALPERVGSVVSVTLNGSTAMTYTVAVDARSLENLVPSTNPGDVVTVFYTAIRPLPQNGEQLCVWYDYRAPQTLRVAVLVSPFVVEPRCIASSLYSLTVGPGSQDEAYPYPYGYVQTGGVKTVAGYQFRGDF